MEIPIDLDDLERQLAEVPSGAVPASGGEAQVIVEHGVVRQSDGRLARLGGYRREEVVDTIFASFFHQEDVPLVEAVCRMRPSPAGYRQRANVRLMGKDGTPIPVEITAAGGRPPARRIRIRHL